MNRTDGSFDKLAADYSQYRTGYSSKLYDQLEELGFKSGMHVLDVGCGTGIASEPLAERGMKITGADPSEPMLVFARRAIPSGTFVQGRAESLPFGEGEFDAAICAQTIHWCDQGKALEEMVRVVKPGGRIAIWWNQLMADEAMRSVQAEACAAAGVDQPKDVMVGAFRAFYSTQLKERWVRVIPHMVTTDSQRWLGYERTRGRAIEALGGKQEGYLAELQRLLVEKSEEKPFQVRFTQFLYVAEVG
jgi:ubiquinone/menaquinone biosynthesis C-methylase UbiE